MTKPPQWAACVFVILCPLFERLPVCIAEGTNNDGDEIDEIPNAGDDDAKECAGE